MTDKLLKLIIEVPKNESSVVYFTFEANEGLCFYSTLPHIEGSQVRLIEIFVTKSLHNEFLTVFNFLKKKVEIKIVEDFTEEQ